MRHYIKREETPLYAVATTPQRRMANGRVVVRNGVKHILKHEPYAKKKLEAKVLTGYTLPVSGYR